MNDLAERLASVQGSIADAARDAGRNPHEVTTIVVTKFQPVSLIRDLVELGVHDIGENRHQEAQQKAAELADVDVRWHFVGQLQGKKARQVRAYASAIHSVDRTSLVRELSKSNKKPPVFVQINVSGEASKGGFTPEESEAAVAEAKKALDVVGLMTMAPEGVDARPHFRRLRELAARLGLAGLSMGMTQDFEAAVEEGATHVRVGTAIFDGVLI